MPKSREGVWGEYYEVRVESKAEMELGQLFWEALGAMF